MSMRHHISRVVVVAFALVVAGCASDDSLNSTDAAIDVQTSTTPATAASTSTIVTSTSSTTTTAALLVSGTTAAMEFQYGNADVASDEQPPGLYKSPDWFSLAFTFETTEAYRGIGERLADSEIFGIAQGSKAVPQRQLLLWASTPGATAQDFLVELGATPKLDFGEERTATVAGFGAKVVDASASVPASIQALGTLVGVPDSWKTNSPEVRLRFMVLSIGDRTLVIYIEAPDADFDDFIRSADEFLATVEFLPTES
jgi:hypothetical protein